MFSANVGSGQYVDQSVFNNIASLSQNSLSEALMGLFSPGLINPNTLTISFSGLVGTITFPSGTNVLFSNGHLATPIGVANGVSSGTYTVNFTAPLTGSQTYYLLASEQTIGINPISIVGPPPGHPDFDPTFSPYISYIENVVSVALSISTTPPNNTTTFEILRTTISSGQTSISVWETIYQRLAGVSGTWLNTQTFSSAGSFTYTPTLGTTKAKVTVIGGGGGGGGCNSTTSSGSMSGSGGGSGARACAKIAITGPVSIVVGAGGTPPADATASSFGTFITCPGGQSGYYAVPTSSAGGSGGALATISGVIETIFNLTGSDGSDGQNGPLIFAGDGAPGYLGSDAGRAAAGPPSGGGHNGRGSGAGGGGTYNSLTGAATTGGQGLIIIEEFL